VTENQWPGVPINQVWDELATPFQGVYVAAANLRYREAILHASLDEAVRPGVPCAP
jgi:hypothetical protein